MKNIKRLLVILSFLICFIIGTNIVHAIDITEEVGRKIDFTVTENVKVDKEISNSKTQSVIDQIIRNGYTTNLSTGLVGIYCQITGVPHGGFNNYMKKENAVNATYSNDPKKAYIYSNPSRSSTRSEWCSGVTQNLSWYYRGFTSLSSQARIVWNNALAFEDYGNNRIEWEENNGRTYTGPTVLQTNPVSVNFLAGPYQLDYVMGNEKSTYICAIKNMELKDKEGNVIKHSTAEDLGDTPYWYVADKNGNPIDNGTYGNFPFPNEDFYIKVKNFRESKAFLNVVIEKVEAEAMFIHVSGRGYQKIRGGMRCSNCVAIIQKCTTIVEYGTTRCTNESLCNNCQQTKDKYENMGYGYLFSPCGRTYQNKNNPKYCRDYVNNYPSKMCSTCQKRYCYKKFTTNMEVEDLTTGGTTLTKVTAQCSPSLEYLDFNSQPQELVGYSKRTETEVNLDVEVKLDCVDIALRKFITGITDIDDIIYNSDGTVKDSESKKQAITNRIPTVDTNPIRQDISTTATYTHTKEPLKAKVGDIIEYTIRVYNEGTADGYAEEVKDYLPSNLEFISGVVDGVDYGWKATEENGRTVITTSYLSDKILLAFQKEGVYRPHNVGEDGLDYKDLKLTCRIKDAAIANEVITNIAEVSKYKDKYNNILRGDVDSEPNNILLPSNEQWPNYNKNQEDDDDYEKLIIEYTDIEGTVWEDCEEGKQEERDNILTNKDKRFANIDVELYQDRNNDGNYIKIATTKTDANGHYKFDRFNVEGITTNPDNSYTISPIRLEVNKKYIVKFGYGGQQYEPVTVTALTSNEYTIEKSAGHEVVEERQELNASLFEIVNGTSSKKADGTIGVNGVIKYDKDTNKHTSTLIRDRARAEGEAFWQATKIWSTTDSFPGTLSNEKIHNVNQGLYERAQINFGIMNDVKEAELVINGKSSIYEYSRKDEGKAMTIDLTTEDIKTVYNQAIYKSDYMYRIDDYKTGYYTGGENPGTYGAFADNLDNTTLKNGDELEVYLTYKIKVKNYSPKPGSITELVHYYSNEYTLIDSWYEKSGSTGKVNWRAGNEITVQETIQTGGEHTQNVTYQEIFTDGIKDVTIGGNEEVYVYVKYQVNKGEDRADVLTNNGYQEDGQSVLLGERYVYTEITGYSSQEGLIDLNSEPGNMKINNIDEYVNSYEDDTDRAPGINLHIETEAPTRELVGYVFEDMIAGTDNDGVNIGNGTFEGNDKKVNGVRVQLIELVEQEGKTYEYIWQEMFTGNGKTSYMDRKGNLITNERNAEGLEEGQYRFTQYIPGNYLVRFIYGDTVRTLYYNGQDYKYTKYVGYGEETSSVRDNKERRKQQIDYATTITSEKGEILAANTESNPLHIKLLENTWMNADTQEVMNITVNMKDPGHKVNCGIIRRPKTELTMIKEVTGLKVVNNGIIYVDTANGVETGLKKLPDGNYSLELDDELLNGAELYADYSLKVVNTGEKDTLNNYFEGDTTYGANQHEIITTSADIVYDYPQNMGYDEGTNEGWTTQNINHKILKQEVQDKISKDNRVLIITTQLLKKDLKPRRRNNTSNYINSKGNGIRSRR